LGCDLVDRMAAERVVPDLSHLSDRSLQQLLERTDDLVVATHSNCRALLDDDMRHLTDETIREIARRGGVVGLNLYSGFLDSKHMRSGRATIDDCVRHVEHVCGLVGSTAHIGLGSDLDGGFDATHLPRGIDRPTDLAKLFEALAGNGWSEDDLDAFTHRNWRRVFQSD
ncbi:MAG: membrane dipeptidase, partial [Planctomycetota bacterium]